MPRPFEDQNIGLIIAYVRCVAMFLCQTYTSIADSYIVWQ